MTEYLLDRAGPGALPLTPLTKESLPDWLDGQDPQIAQWVRSAGFKAAPGSVCTRMPRTSAIICIQNAERVPPPMAATSSTRVPATARTLCD